MQANDSMFAMVLILDGNSEIGAHGERNFDISTCFRHLIRSRAGIIRIFSPKRPIFLHDLNELPSNIGTMNAFSSYSQLGSILHRP